MFFSMNPHSFKDLYTYGGSALIFLVVATLCVWYHRKKIRPLKKRIEHELYLKAEAAGITKRNKL